MSGVQIVDLQFQGVPGVIASSIFETGDGLAVVDPGPTSTLASLEHGLADFGASVQDIRHLLLTHIHLDHAGAAGTLLRRVPQAQVYVHERGAGHLSRPERLVASAAQIYGDQMERLWGEFLPVPSDRMTVLRGDPAGDGRGGGGTPLRLGHLDVLALATPGHAVHHLAYVVGEALFVGDVGGIRLDARQTPRAPTPPPDIDLAAWDSSIALLRDLPVQTLYLAHFGAYPQQAAHWDELHRALWADARRIEAGLRAGQDVQTLTTQFTAELRAELEPQGADLPDRYGFACPPWMSVQGLLRYWQRQAARVGQRGEVQA